MDRRDKMESQRKFNIKFRECLEWEFENNSELSDTARDNIAITIKELEEVINEVR